MCTLIFFLNILNLLESKYSNKFINKEDSDLNKLEPFNKQDYINIINYETNNFSSRKKKNWQENDEIYLFKTVNEPQAYFLKSIIKKKLEKSNNNLSSIVGFNEFYKSKYFTSVSTLNDRNRKHPLLPQELVKRNSSSSFKIVTTKAKQYKKQNKKPTPFKIWIEEINNNERKKYVTYIDVDKQISRFPGGEEVLESTLSYDKQTTDSNMFYFEPLEKIPVKDGNKIIMAKRNFPIFLPVLKWKTKKEETGKLIHVTLNKLPAITEKQKSTSTTVTTTKIKSVMDKLNEINLDEKCFPEHKKTTKYIIRHITTKKYSEQFCGTETDIPCTDPTVFKHCKNYTGIVLCPNCKKKIKFNMELIRNRGVDITGTICPTFKYTC